MGYILALLSICCFAVSNCIWVFPQRRLPFITVIFCRSFFTSILFGGIVFFHGWGKVHHSLNFPSSFQDVPQAILISLISSVGLLLYTFSLRFTTVSIAVPTSSISSFFGLLTAVFILHEALHLQLILIFFLLLTGLLLLDNRNPIKTKAVFSVGIWLNIGAAIFWGITFALFFIPVGKLGPWTFSLILESSVCTVSFILFLSLAPFKAGSWLVIFSQIKWILLLAILGFGGVLFYNLAIQSVPVSQLALMGCLTPVLSVLFSIRWLKEKVTPYQLFGIFCIAAGILWIVYS